MLFSRRLAISKMPGHKKDKSNITLVLTCNSTGTLINPLVNGKSINHRALRGLNMDDIIYT